MIELALLLAALASLLAIAFFSGSEMGLYGVNRVRLRLRGDKPGASSARALLGLIDRLQESVLAVLLWQNVAGYLLTVALSVWLLTVVHVNPRFVEYYSAALLSPLVFVFGDVVPKNWFRVDADRLMYPIARLLQASVAIFRYTGVLWLLRHTTRLGAWLAGHDESDDWGGARAEVVGLFREGAAEGVLTEEQADIVERVMNLSSIRVGSIMIPRQQVITVPIDAGQSTFEHLVRLYHYSRMPVIGHDRKTVVGVVNVHDILADGTYRGIEAWMAPPVTIRARDSAAAALVQLQRAHAAIAVVTDPRRGFVGIVTLKDVVEEIFGELPAW